MTRGYQLIVQFKYKMTVNILLALNKIKFIRSLITIQEWDWRQNEQNNTF